MPWDRKRLLGYVETIQLILWVTDNYIFKASVKWIFRILQPFIASWTTQNLFYSYQAHLPVQFASNIEFIRQMWHWCCDWQRATPEFHVQNKLVFAPLAVPLFRFALHQNS